MVADMVTDMEMEVYMVDDIEVDKVDDMVADNNKKIGLHGVGHGSRHGGRQGG